LAPALSQWTGCWAEAALEDSGLGPSSTSTLITQEFVYALTFISTESNQMLQVGVPIFLVRGDVYYWGSLMAACLLASIPTAFIYNLFLDRFVAGFTVGAVK